MIHLFSKVYLAHDTLIDMHYDRVVISERNGVHVPSLLDDITNGDLLGVAPSYEEMIGEGKQFDTFISLLSLLGNKVEEHGGRVFIFADSAAFNIILSHWYGVILPNINYDSLISLGKSIQFKFNAFNGGSRSSVSNQHYREIDMSNLFLSPAEETEDLTSFIELYRGKFSVEYLIASYLYDGSHKEELKSVMLKIYKKSLEVLMTDIKEGFLVTLLHKGFAERFNLDQVYTFDNFTDILNDQSDIAQLFLSDRLWHSPWIKLPSSTSSSYSNLKTENITQEDAIAFKQAIVDFAEYSMGDLIWNSTLKKEEIKLDFIEVFSNFTDDLLDDMLAADRDSESVHGAFFPINLETVNHYLIRTLMYAHRDGDIDTLRLFTVR